MSVSAPPLKTPLHEEHLALGAKLVDFGGWLLPSNYSSQVEEHHAVRKDVGMFDVSHMTVSDITGEQTLAFLSTLLANDINKATTFSGKALYSCMLNEDGGVIDDLIVYYINDQHCRIVTNAATNKKDMAWIKKQAEPFNTLVAEKPELALIAVQGPNAIKKVYELFSTEKKLNALAELINSLKRFQGGFADDYFVGRTGYTGEDGIEMILPADKALSIWKKLSQSGIQACGLGARDTLRLEAGMALYGSDLDEGYTPLDCGLSWTVGLKDDRHFIGKGALLSPSKFKMIGLILEDKGVLRGHQTVLINGDTIGEITSGTFSPTLKKSIALARINTIDDINIGSLVQVQIRQKQVNARVVKYPFIKQ